MWNGIARTTSFYEFLVSCVNSLLNPSSSRLLHLVPGGLYSFQAVPVCFSWFQGVSTRFHLFLVLVCTIWISSLKYYSIFLLMYAESSATKIWPNLMAWLFLLLEILANFLVNQIEVFLVKPFLLVKTSRKRHLISWEQKELFRLNKKYFVIIFKEHSSSVICFRVNIFCSFGVIHNSITKRFLTF